MKLAGPFILCLALGMGPLAAPPSYGQAAPPKVFVNRMVGPSYTAEAKAAFNESIDKLNRAFRAVLVETQNYQAADYQLIDPSLEVKTPQMVKLTMRFVVRGQQADKDPPSVLSAKLPRFGDQVRNAVDGLLLRTLFNHRRGPYGAIRVKKCTKEGGNLVLELNWDRGPGLESELVYELGQVGAKYDTGLGAYYYLADPEPLGNHSARVTVGETVRTGDVDPLSCERLLDGKSILLMRLWAPGSGEGDSHGNKATP